MAKNKTTETQSSVTDFINTVPDETKRNDCFQIAAIYEELTGYPPKMWGGSIIGYGSYHYKYNSGHEGDMPYAAFSPRKDSIVLYIDEFETREQLLQKLGKHKTGKVCVYIKKLADIDIDIMKQLITASTKHAKALYP
jgi:Domain of unknown function (DU1801).